MNTLKTIFLLGILSALIVGAGSYFGGHSGVIIAFVFALVMNIGSYWFSAPLALRMSNAQPVSRDQAPDLYKIVEDLAERMDIPCPDIYIIPSRSPNAFATGRDPQHSSVAVTAGILELLNLRELRGVLAHELGHVINRDILITTISAVLASVITTVAHLIANSFFYRDERDEGGMHPLVSLLYVVLAPLAATLINLGISRAREFQADQTGAEVCEDPLALASALDKIDQVAHQIPLTSANPALSSLFIIKPDAGSWFVNLLSTHPPTVERIQRLQNIADRH